MKLRHGRLPVVALAAVTGIAALLAPVAADAASAGPDRKTRFQLSAGAYGTTVNAVGGAIESGRTAAVGFGCTRQVPLDRENDAADVDLGALGTVGAVTTHVTSAKVGGRVETESTTRIAQASLLGGQVEVEGLEVVARTWHARSGGYQAETETTVASLVIGGEEIAVGEDEQTISIPGVATVVVNGSATKERATWARAEAVGLRITLVGGEAARIVVASASAGIDGRQYDGTFAGGGHGSTVEVGGVVEAGRTAKKSLPCLGTGGRDRTNSTAAVDLGAVEIGAVETTVNGDTAVPKATVTNQVADVAVDLGVAELRIEGVTTQVHVVESGGTVTADLGASSVASIVVDPLVGPEIELPVDVEPGTTVDLPLGLGSITFFDARPFKGVRGLALTGLQIELPTIDTDITVGSARAAIRR